MNRMTRQPNYKDALIPDRLLTRLPRNPDAPGTLERMPSSAVVLWALLDVYSDRTTSHCDLTLSEIAELQNLDRRHVIRLLQSLEDNGWLRVVREGNEVSRFLEGQCRTDGEASGK